VLTQVLSSTDEVIANVTQSIELTDMIFVHTGSFDAKFEEEDDVTDPPCHTST
jgi:hypothetical protein